MKQLIAGLHSLERKVVPYLKDGVTLSELVKKSGLKEVEVMRALQWLENKEVLKIKLEVSEEIKLDKLGSQYVKEGLPEKIFLKSIKGKTKVSSIKLDKQEVNACIGILKRKAAIDITKEDNNLIVSITANGEKLLNKDSLEEQFLKKLPINLEELKPEEKLAYKNLSSRRNIIKTELIKNRTIKLTDIGKELSKQKLSDKFIGTLTPKMLENSSWKGQEFRAYDVKINVPQIYGGKRHFVNQAMDYARKVWIELGFKEMEGPILNTSFWNFDALFVPQDHPAREMQDTFFIKKPKQGKLPNANLVKNIKLIHEKGDKVNSQGWQYDWSPNESKRNVLRTHTTVLSSKTLAKLKKSDWPAKYFAVGKCFRNEAVDWKHLFEFNQTEGIVVDPNANFRHLLGYLKKFFGKLGFPDARFRPAYFPYTEMSVEIDVYHPQKKQWVELGGAGMFRPEVVEPLLGEPVPVLAWGPGFDRLIVDFYKIKDLRDLYRNDVKQLRDIKIWRK
ncbi:MAG: phenylalanine--tRNA ligase subunit alpha [archaeon]